MANPSTLLKPPALAGSEAGAEPKKRGLWLMLWGTLTVPMSLLWDYSWECSIGIDTFCSPPHLATYASAILVLCGALVEIRPRAVGVRIGPFAGAAGAWIAIWGCAAFFLAVAFDRWWQGAYGLSAGIWHPPQICKAVAFFTLAMGTWVRAAEEPPAENENCAKEDWPFAISAGLFLTLIALVNLTASLPNRQHSGWFYEISCACYPVALVVASVASRSAEFSPLQRPTVRRCGLKSSLRGFGATKAAIVYTLIWCVMLWGLPLFHAKPLVAPVYNAMEHMMAPSFPLLLIIPAIAIDLSMWWCADVLGPFRFVGHSVIAGITFALTFSVAQWFFAAFLLSNAADNWFFAGGGKHWPFFIRIDGPMRQSFWTSPADELNEASGMVATMWAIVSAWGGCWVGAWMRGLRR